MTVDSSTLPHVATSALRAPAALSVALMCVLQLVSCSRAQDPSPVSSPTSSRRQPPAPPERCVEVPVAVVAPVCG